MAPYRWGIVALALSLLWLQLTVAVPQPAKVPRIGVLYPGSPSAAERLQAMLLQGLHDLGYVEGQNITFTYRYAEEKPERLPNLAAELVQLPVDVIVAGPPEAVQAAKQVTSTIPIVMVTGGPDPVGAGFVTSLARPGGNVTGVSLVFGDEFAGKWVALLKEALPQVSRVAVLWDPTRPMITATMQEVERVAQGVGLRLQHVAVRQADEFDAAFAAMVREGSEALIVLRSATFSRARHRLVELVATHRLPAIYEDRRYVEAGGRMSYGSNPDVVFYRAGYYVDRILKGTKPADLPVEQPVKFELVINLKTAQALGLTIPPSILFQADEVIK
jgi:putative tryptophan/tyrosine transport system substrate-binding protein